MHAITIITGQRQEGKTSELIEKYKDILEELANYEVPISYKARYILCCPDKEISHSAYRTICETNGFCPDIANDESHLRALLLSSVSDSDCAIFIDEPELVMENFSSWILEFADSFPNDNISNGCDIVYTRPRK